MDSIHEINWCEAWRKHNNARPKAHDSSHWDERSQSFKEHSGRSSYAKSFISLLDLPPAQSILDMGCGAGIIALPLARAGHQLIAADFSEGMLAVVQQKALEEGLRNMYIKRLDWRDDWPAKGILPKSVDVALASRSTIVEDLADALLKLDTTARTKVAITMTTEYGPKGKEHYEQHANGTNRVPDYVFALNMLIAMGAFPELRYIDIIRDRESASEPRLVRWAYLSWKPIT